MKTNETKPEVFLVKDKWLLQTTGMKGRPQVIDVMAIREVDDRGKDGATLIRTTDDGYQLTTDGVEDVIAALRGTPNPQEVGTNQVVGEEIAADRYEANAPATEGDDHE